ncbi:hypothetical protein [Parvibaculum sp.]|jgi:hypothetical protein|uniref:hypothetical protein n=1 Tax=Parvibaculum sp. TaxID=2024848 RepID=UPI000C4CB163|nr:hypothetical protein [Parvibaculum sp.]MAU61718.1 hypothetical protein [Parvibaculum sp.]MBO6677976.1 hypothetical protein [Parvibaculum sp.]MBO6683308.1 hypothetical protein [Parvibaculum sp.]MBO6905180.1 hypothetical protein [Parvibaculum sp.]|tara:strand:+ start:3446 stop:3643 length:198 start_codon:yes stop_codon:yes gene_type:complete
MTQNRNNQPRRSFIADLCVHMSEEEIAAAEDRFRRYVEIVRRIHEYVEEQSADAEHPAGNAADSP